MKTRHLLILLVAILTGCPSILAQGFTPPSEGKSVVYFVRQKRFYAKALSFEYFHYDKYIGIFKGTNYMRYECDPGEQLLWASSENKEFLDCNLEAGKTYVVFVTAVSGMGKARVKLKPITEKDTEAFKEAKKTIMSKPPVEMKEEVILEKNERLKEFIANKLEQYENEWKGGENDHPLTPDMAISEEAMK